ncbi:MAG: protein kinase [Candidatus Desulfatibia sp.]|uniref:bifunctional serine/threonine-protein kinase/formylglycine-generating enzyme family protein n=1 Tax=Candidatus Desulfatibia sp. TaxID=3101189 RepID=UPI002F3430CB
MAIKVISQEMLQSFEDDPEGVETAVQRFRREVEAMARVRHPNVLQIFDYGSDLITTKGQDIQVEYIVMEFIPGTSLRFTMSEEGFYPEQNLTAGWLVDYFLPLLEGVEAIHAQEIAHRDLKPENVLLDAAIPKIADFGLAGSSRMKPVTQSIDVRGTPAYMSPEHFFDFKKADQHSDIYSLGKILYEAVDGKLGQETIPFKSVGLQNKDTPFFQQLDRIIQNATAEKKEKRLQSVGELRKKLVDAIDLLKTETADDTAETHTRFSFLTQPVFIWAGILIAIVSVGLMGLWHLMGEPAKTTERLRSPQTPPIESSHLRSQEPAKSVPSATPAPAPSIRGKDGLTMLLIPGGEVKTASKVSTTQGETVSVPSFYIDEKMVSNHRFTEFLNEVKESLTIENGVVKNNDKIWFYLGKGSEPFEQIVYEHGRFQLRNAKHAVQPVVRVTWYGARAYARHYDKRLVTESEWNYLFSKQSLSDIIALADKTDSPPAKTQHVPADSETHNIHMMNMDTPAGGGETSGNTPAERHALNETYAPPAADTAYDLKQIKEWAIRSAVDRKEMSATGAQGNIGYPSIVIDKSLRHGPASKSFRYPWEAFPDVGFRCARSLS